MFEVLVLIVGFIILLLAVIWWHFIRSSKQQAVAMTGAHREDTNVALYKEHKAEIEKDFNDGKIDEESHQYLLAELDKSLLQDIEQNKKAQATNDASVQKLSVIWPIGLSVFVLMFSLAMYSQHGAYERLAQPRMVASNDQAQQAQQEQMHAQLQQLQQAVATDPNNADAWYGLGQLYVTGGQFQLAVEAFDKVIAIEGEQADLLGAKAQATYYGANQTITPEVQTLIDRALALDANDPSTNILLGMHNFMNQSYQQAINYWQKVVDAGRQTVNVAALTEAINEAKSRLSLTQGESNQGDATDANTAAIGPQLTLSVELDEKFVDQLNQGEDKVVFVYAVPANGGRMPVAAVKLMASDLPTQVVLNDARAMSPQMTLSMVETVNVYAVVSQLGGAGIQPGDFKAEVNNVKVNTTAPIAVKIDTLVP
ncbi:c-type cytochrome biogenesis protein CcmI [Thalassotalea euphylliae]|uniref:C-type cytochrome biogenesis protein CcmI n=1 Tax=Thalassotalea euphylliae TaxID=1655234 RepID=A0A3E0UJB7_9GAMM|nr:c-type cytochrome biogenesis protein CcmI [Thalassotalea euphylliae]REL36717.1 c-type cytochrome biogenesis protein CcmI [Thalassotalea euphylliae]